MATPLGIQVVEENDWRLQGQENYLQGVSLSLRPYGQYKENPSWDHDHCEFCQAKFMVEGKSGSLAEGYTTEDEYHWICPDCFADFRERFAWRLVKVEDSCEDS